MYIGVKELIGHYKKPFDRIGIATKEAKASLRDKGDKQTKELLQEEINLVIAKWDEKTNNGSLAHTKIHNREIEKNPNCTILGKYKKYNSEETPELDAENINKLNTCTTYLEKQIVSNHHNIIGYIDKVEVTKQGVINIEDYKTWDKVYRTSSFVKENGFKVLPRFFFSPIDNLQDTNYWEATLQLSIYMYILWTYNKKLKPGKLYIRHIPLNERGLIINEKLIEVPYLRKEVKLIFKNMKLNG